MGSDAHGGADFRVMPTRDSTQAPVLCHAKSRRSGYTRQYVLAPGTCAPTQLVLFYAYRTVPDAEKLVDEQVNSFSLMMLLFGHHDDDDDHHHHRRRGPLTCVHHHAHAARNISTQKHGYAYMHEFSFVLSSFFVFSICTLVHNHVHQVNTRWCGLSCVRTGRTVCVATPQWTHSHRC